MTNPEINDRTTGFFALIIILLILFFLRLGSSSSTTPGEPCDKPVFVQIAGEINSPGVYTFCHRANLVELINRAGGFSFSDDPAEAFKDFSFPSGMRVIIQRDGVGCIFSQDEMSAFYKLTLGMPISLNRESEEGLTAIPGIGPGLANAIVWERSKRGGFKNLDEMLSVNGIGHKVFGKIRPFLAL